MGMSFNPREYYKSIKPSITFDDFILFLDWFRERFGESHECYFRDWLKRFERGVVEFISYMDKESYDIFICKLNKLYGRLRYEV